MGFRHRPCEALTRCLAVSRQRMSRQHCTGATAAVLLQIIDFDDPDADAVIGAGKDGGIHPRRQRREYP